MKNRLCLLFVFLCCSILLFGQGRKQKYDIAAFLYPAYASDDPRLRPFWPRGIGEWETVMTMQKRNPGHYWERKPLHEKNSEDITTHTHFNKQFFICLI